LKKYLLKFVILLFLLINPNIIFGQITIDIQATFNGKSIVKNSWYKTAQKDSIQFKKIQFYLTDFKIMTIENNIISIDSSNFLIDLFKAETLKQELKESVLKNIKEISFNIGVKDSLNTIGALAGNLDPSKGMYWSWQSGYINFKIEGNSPSCKTRKNKFQFHIGGYKNPYKTTKRVYFKVENTAKESITIHINIANFFDQIDLKNENQIMIPGEKARKIAEILPKLFSIDD
jgi:hypothetical protein